MKKLAWGITILGMCHFALLSVALSPISQDMSFLFSGPLAHGVAFFGIAAMMYILGRHYHIAHEHPMLLSVGYSAILVFIIEVLQALMTSYRQYDTIDMFWGWAGVLLFAGGKMIVYDLYVGPWLLKVFPKLQEEERVVVSE